VYHGALDSKYGDSVIIGASSPEQLISNLDMIEQGHLPKDVVEALEVVYKEIADSEIPYHF
jgi:aflatoxin B1 aldehyde reductase